MRIRQSNIQVKDYLYHTIGGFNLYALTSILKNGILSKQEAEVNKIKSNSSGLAENGYNRISLSRSWVLEKESYAALHLSLIVDTKGLNIVPNLSANCPGHEVQVYNQIPPNNIIGIHIPDYYLINDLNGLIVLGIHDEDPFIINMSNLDTWVQNEFNCSIYSNSNIKADYQQAIDALHNKRSSDYQRIKVQLNADLMNFFNTLYTQKIGKEIISVIDMIEYHTKGEIPLYNSDGNLLTSQDIKLPTPKFSQSGREDVDSQIIDAFISVTGLPEKFKNWLEVSYLLSASVDFPPQFSFIKIQETSKKLNELGIECKPIKSDFSFRDKIEFQLTKTNLLKQLKLLQKGENLDKQHTTLIVSSLKTPARLLLAENQNNLEDKKPNLTRTQHSFFKLKTQTSILREHSRMPPLKHLKLI